MQRNKAGLAVMLAFSAAAAIAQEPPYLAPSVPGAPGAMMQQPQMAPAGAPSVASPGTAIQDGALHSFTTRDKNASVATAKSVAAIQEEIAVEELRVKLRGMQKGPTAPVAGPNGVSPVDPQTTQTGSSMGMLNRVPTPVPKNWAQVAAYGQPGRLMADVAKGTTIRTIKAGDRLDGMTVVSIDNACVKVSTGKARTSCLPMWEKVGLYPHVRPNVGTGSAAGGAVGSAGGTGATGVGGMMGTNPIDMAVITPSSAPMSNTYSIQAK